MRINELFNESFSFLSKLDSIIVRSHSHAIP